MLESAVSIGYYIFTTVTGLYMCNALFTFVKKHHAILT